MWKCNCNSCICRLIFQFFSVPVYDAAGRLLSTKQIREQLEKVVEKSQSKIAPVGILTTGNRNTWGKVYSTMMKGKLY